MNAERMRSSWSFLFVAVLLLGLAAGREVTAQLRVSPLRLDFGDMGHRRTGRALLTVRNAARIPVVITNIKPTCDCIKIQPSHVRGPLPPGKQVQFTVAMRSGRAMGVLRKYIEFETDQRNRRLRVPVLMRVHQGFTMKPRELRYMGAVGGEPVKKELVISRRRGDGAVKLEITDLVHRSGKRKSLLRHFKTSVEDAPNGKRVGVTLLPTLPEGRIFAELKAQLNGRQLVVPVVGEMFRGIQLSSRNFVFSRVAGGTSRSPVHQVELKSTDKKLPFSILKTEVRAKRPSDRFTLRVSRSPASGSATKHVLQAQIVAADDLLPQKGRFYGDVVVHTSHPEKKAITLRYFGFFAAPKR